MQLAGTEQMYGRNKHHVSHNLENCTVKRIRKSVLSSKRIYKILKVMFFKRIGRKFPEMEKCHIRHASFAKETCRAPDYGFVVSFWEGGRSQRVHSPSFRRFRKFQTNSPGFTCASSRRPAQRSLCPESPGGTTLIVSYDFSSFQPPSVWYPPLAGDRPFEFTLCVLIIINI